MKTVLYIHGMGGGQDSRIPSILNDWFGATQPDIRVVVRTYDFHPERAAAQIDAWYAELQPDLVIGESLGSVHALALLARRSSGADGATTLRGCRDVAPSGGMHPQTVAPPSSSGALPAFPLLLVSPALNAPKFLYALRGIARIPAARKLLQRIYKPREGRRQALDFMPETLRAWGVYRRFLQSFKPGDPGLGGAFPEGSLSLLLRDQGQAARTPAPVYAFFGRRDHYRRSGVVSLRQWRRTFGPGTYALYDGTHFMEETYLRELLIPAIRERI